ncbi:MAG: hypothetical protein WBP72_11385, partial [Rhodocyclaceae bacterium]
QACALKLGMTKRSPVVQIGILLVLALLLALQAGCAVVAVPDAAVTVGVVAVKSTAEVAGASVNVATYPFRKSGSSEKEEE